MKRILIAVFLLSGSTLSLHAAPSWRTVQIGSNTTLTPGLQDGGINVASGTIRVITSTSIVVNATTVPGVTINETSGGSSSAIMRFKSQGSDLLDLRATNSGQLCSDLATSCATAPTFNVVPSGGITGLSLDPTGKVAIGGSTFSGSTVTVRGSLSVGQFSNTVPAAPVDGMSVKGSVVIGTHTANNAVLRVFSGSSDFLSVSTNGVTSISTLTITSGSDWPSFDRTSDGLNYRLNATSSTVSAGQCAVYSSTSGATIGGTCGGVASSGIVVSSAVIVTSSGSLVLYGPTQANYVKHSLTDSLYTMQFFQSGVGDNLMTFSTSGGFSVNTKITATAGLIQTSGALQSIATGGSSTTDAAGALELRADTGQPTFMQFRENAVADRGALGFAGGASRFKFMKDGSSIGAGTDVWGINTDGGMTPYLRTLAQLQTLTPTSAGEIFYCSTCATDGIVVSTGTTAGAFGRISARSTNIQ